MGTTGLLPGIGISVPTQTADSIDFQVRVCAEVIVSRL